MSLHGEVLDLMYFNLENNDDALSYFERDGYDTSELIPFIKDEIYKLNEAIFISRSTRYYDGSFRWNYLICSIS